MKSRHLVTIKDADEFAELAGAWDALLERSRAASVFLSSAWLLASYRTLTPGAPFFALLCYQENALLGGLMAIHRDAELVVVGDGPSDYLDVLIDPDLSDAEAVEVCDALCRHGLELTNAGGLRIRGVVERGRLLERLHASTLFPVVTRRTVAPSMDMANAPAAIRKKSLKRHTNKLARAGELVVTTACDARTVIPQLPAFFRQHQARWAAVGQRSQFDADVQRELFEALTHAMARAGALRFTTVALDGHPVAFHFGMVSHGRFTWYKPTYSPDYAEYSPGEVLLRALIERAQTEPVDEFDFTVGAEPFKLRFATVVRDVVDITVFRSPAKARALSHKIRTRELLKRNAPALAERLRGL